MKKKVLLTGILSIVMCLSLIAGATFALFTSESKVNIAVTSGNVEVVATIDDEVKLWSGKNEMLDGKFANGGSVIVEDASIGFNLMMPGDSAEFTINVENKSNVSIQYRTIVEPIEDDGLLEALEIKIDGEILADSIVSDWSSDLTEKDVKITITLPEDAGNEYQDKSCKLLFKVEAIQGGAAKDSFENNGNGTYTINDKYGLWSFAKRVNTGTSYNGEIVNLATDIDLENVNWTPIGSKETPFQGTFNGAGNTIKNLKVVGENNVGLFGYVSNGEPRATIKNVNILNADVKGVSQIGAIAGSLYTATADNCHVSGNVKIEGNYKVGGITGYGYSIITNSSVNGGDKLNSYIKATHLEKDIEGDKVGGIIGLATEGTADRVVNCSVKNITVEGTRSIGGLVGTAGYGVSVLNSSAENVDIRTNATEEYAANNKIAIAGMCGEVNSNYASTVSGSLTDISIAGVDGLYTGKVYGRNRGSADISEITFNVNEYNVKIVILVSTSNELTNAVANAVDGTTIAFENDITGDAVLLQKADVKVTIEGCGFNYSGTMTVNGKSSCYDTTGTTIKGVNFVADSITYGVCINLGNKDDSNTRYTNHVTVDNCTFNVPNAVAIKSYTGGDKNLTIKDCVIKADMHSLAQLANVEEGLTITKCEVYSKNGINLNSTPSVTMTGCIFDVKGYAVRFGVDSADAEGFNGNFDLSGNSLKSACEETDDAVIIIRKTARPSTINLTNTEIVGSVDIRITPDPDNKTPEPTIIK